MFGELEDVDVLAAPYALQKSLRGYYNCCTGIEETVVLQFIRPQTGVLDHDLADLVDDRHVIALAELVVGEVDLLEHVLRLQGAEDLVHTLVFQEVAFVCGFTRQLELLQGGPEVGQDLLDVNGAERVDAAVVQRQTLQTVVERQPEAQLLQTLTLAHFKCVRVCRTGCGPASDSAAASPR